MGTREGQKSSKRKTERKKEILWGNFGKKRKWGEANGKGRKRLWQDVIEKGETNGRKREEDQKGLKIQP